MSSHSQAEQGTEIPKQGFHTRGTFAHRLLSIHCHWFTPHPPCLPAIPLHYQWSKDPKHPGGKLAAVSWSEAICTLHTPAVLHFFALAALQRCKTSLFSNNFTSGSWESTKLCYEVLGTA